MDDRVLYLIDLINDDLGYQDINCELGNDYQLDFIGEHISVSVTVGFRYDEIVFQDMKIRGNDYIWVADSKYILQELKIIFDVLDNYNGSILQM